MCARTINTHLLHFSSPASFTHQIPADASILESSQQSQDYIKLQSFSSNKILLLGACPMGLAIWFLGMSQKNAKLPSFQGSETWEKAEMVCSICSVSFMTHRTYQGNDKDFIKVLWDTVEFKGSEPQSSCCHHLSNKSSTERLARFPSVSLGSWEASTSFPSSLWFIQIPWAPLTSGEWSRVGLCHNQQLLKNYCLKNVLEFYATTVGYAH